MDLKQLLLIRLPLDITNIILEYANFHRLRNCQYMNQIITDGKEGGLYRRIEELITRMPKKSNGYVVLKMSETISEIIMGPSFYYLKTNRL
jgi:hypothetical protein